MLKILKINNIYSIYIKNIILGALLLKNQRERARPPAHAVLPAHRARGLLAGKALGPGVHADASVPHGGRRRGEGSGGRGEKKLERKLKRFNLTKFLFGNF
jgi:hypothetical protein